MPRSIVKFRDSHLKKLPVFTVIPANADKAKEEKLPVTQGKPNPVVPLPRKLMMPPQSRGYIKGNKYDFF